MNASLVTIINSTTLVMECLDKKRKSIKYCYKALSGELGIKFLINSVLATINSANSQIVKTEEEE